MDATQPNTKPDDLAAALAALYGTTAPHHNRRINIRSPKKDERGKVEYPYKAIVAPLEHEDWVEHITDGDAIGVHCLNEDGTANWLVLDVDRYGMDVVAAASAAAGGPGYVIRTKSGGAQLHVLLSEPVAPEVLRRIASKLAGWWGYTTDVEVFPSLARTKDGNSRAVVAPYSPLSGPAIDLDTGEEMDLATFLSTVRRVSLADLESFVSQLPEAEITGPGGPGGATMWAFTTGELLNGVAQGGRDNAMWSLACRLRRTGLSREQAEPIILDAAAKCDPPFHPTVALEKLNRAYAKVGDKVTSNPPEHTSLGVARFFVEMYGSVVRYDHAQKCWFTWGGHYWEQDVASGAGALELLTHAITVMKTAFSFTKKTAADRHEAFCTRYTNIGALKSALEHASTLGEVGMRGDEWDRHPYKLACPNGVVDLRTGLLEQGQPEDYLILATKVPYDPGAAAPQWERFLRQVFAGDEEMVAFMQRDLGYSATGSTAEQKMTLLVGEGSNGKSVLLEVIKRVLGGYATTLDLSALLGKALGGASPEVASLRGVRFAGAAEMRTDSMFNEAAVKRLTGSDEIVSRYLYGNPFRFSPTHKIWLAVNALPNVRDVTNGLWRRLIIVRFDVAFATAEDIATDPRWAGAQVLDPMLTDKLVAEAPGILAWIVRGAVEWHKGGLQPPASIKSNVDEYAQEQDTLEEFISDQCHVTKDEADRIQAGDFQARYLTWAKANGIAQPHSRVTVGRAMERRFGKWRQNKASCWYYLGLKWVEEVGDAGSQQASADRYGGDSDCPF